MSVVPIRQSSYHQLKGAPFSKALNITSFLMGCDILRYRGNVICSMCFLILILNL